MKPTKEYTGRSHIRMFNADCMEFMKQVDESYDLAIVDPPYGIGVHKMFISKNRIDPRNGREIVCKRNKRGEWDNNSPDEKYFKILKDKSENQIIWGANHFGNMPPSSCWIVWDKVNGKSDQADCELAWTSFNTAVRQLRFMWCIAQGKGIEKGHIAEGNNKLWEKRNHPTQKPVALYKWILTNYAKEGDIILDTHGGSMSIAIACWDLGFDLDIIELDTDYFNDAVKRFENHISQTQLF